VTWPGGIHNTTGCQIEYFHFNFAETTRFVRFNLRFLWSMYRLGTLWDEKSLDPNYQQRGGGNKLVINIHKARGF